MSLSILDDAPAGASQFLADLYLSGSLNSNYSNNNVSMMSFINKHQLIQLMDGVFYPTQKCRLLHAELFANEPSHWYPTTPNVGQYVVLQPTFRGTTDIYERVFRVQQVKGTDTYVCLPEYFVSNPSLLESTDQHRTTFKVTDLVYAVAEEINGGYRIM